MDKKLTRGQLLVLLFLLGAGAGLIWHIGHNILGAEGQSSAGAGAVADRVVLETQKPVKADGGEAEPFATAVKGVEAAKASLETNLPPTAAVKDSVTAAILASGLQDLQSRDRLPRLVVNERGRFLITDAIVFVPGKASLHSISDQALDKITGLLRERSEIRLEILGHTDSFGDEAANRKLTADRAAAVMQYLVSHGIDGSRLSAKGMGSTVPVAPNNSRMGRLANRRIEFWVTSPK